MWDNETVRKVLYVIFDNSTINLGNLMFRIFPYFIMVVTTLCREKLHIVLNVVTDLVEHKCDIATLFYEK